MDELIQSIIQTAIYAPSGDNNQPWRFLVRQNSLSIYNVPESDQTLYNFNQHAALIAHGALIENCVITAAHYGYKANIQLFPPEGDTNLVAIINFVPDPEKKSSDGRLWEYITKRTTNRKPYFNYQLSSDERRILSLEKEKCPDIFLDFTEDTNSRGIIAEAVSQGDRLIFENKAIHDFLFNCIRWNDAEEIKFKTGLFLKTMELNPPQRLFFRLFRKWPVMSVFNKLGFPRIAVKSNITLYKKGTGIGAIILTQDTPINFINAGRLLQKFWLTLTRMDMYLHPLTGIPLLMQHIRAGQTQIFSNSDIQLLTDSYNKIYSTFKPSAGEIFFLFRFGKAHPPSGISLRKEPIIDYQ